MAFRPPRTALVWSAVAVVLVAVAVVGVRAVVQRRDDRGAGQGSHVAVHTAPIVRTTLQNVVTTTGDIGYTHPRALRSTGSGVITELPHIGAITRRGTTLYRVDDQPVVVFYGSTPLFRPINRLGLTGSDVYVVADNLHRLGWFDGYLPDDPHRMTVSWTLHTDLRLWQRSIGATPTGWLEPGQAVVVPGRLRVSKVSVALGDPAAGQIATVTDTAKLITGRGPAGLADGRARLTLPDGSTVPGTVSVSGGVAGDNRVSFTAHPTSVSALAHVDDGVVTVAVTTAVRRNVLAVPIVALLALQGGSRYAVELTDGRLIAVRTGLFTSDTVEVSGTGLRPGLRVVVAS